MTIGNRSNRVSPSGAALGALGALLLAACGGTSPATSATASPTATAAAATSTAGPSSVQATLTGDPSVSGPLVMGSVHFVTCASPSLKGESIVAFESGTDATIGVLLTLRASSIEVRVARGSGTAYTERIFDGTGVSAFDAMSGAMFSSSLSETTPARSNKGTLGAVSSISGSVSCGTFTPGSATVTVTGSTAAGTLNPALTSVRVLCGSNTAGGFVTVTGLSTAGSTPVLVSVLGGIGGSAFFVVIETATVAYQYSSASAGIVTRTGTGATYNGTASETAASPGAAGRSVRIGGSATCGTSS